MIGAENKDVPSYIEAAHPAAVKVDRRSPEEIKQHIIDALGKAR